MKQSDKLLLLGELFNVHDDTTKEARQKQFLDTDVMKNLRDFFRSEEEKSSPRYELLKKEYELLTHTEMETLKVYFICYAHALYLWHSVQNRRFLNPFLCFKNKNEVLLSRIAVDFDGKETYLGDVIMLENYSNDYKIEMVKRSMIQWRKEVIKVVLDPLQILIMRPKNVPHKRKIPGSKIGYGIFLLLMSLCLILLFFLKDNIIYPVFKFDLTRAYFAYPLFAIYFFIFFADFLWMFSISRRRYHMRKYFWAQDVLFTHSQDIVLKINHTTEKLYHYILTCIQKKKEIEGTCKPYSNLDQEYRALKYMLKINEKDGLPEDNMFGYEIVLLEFIFLLLIYLVICYILITKGFIA